MRYIRKMKKDLDVHDEDFLIEKYSKSIYSYLKNNHISIPDQK